MPYPKRLIEVDLPIKRISDHARREKSIRQGHIATMHIWWARRPLAACRAALCASLWPDPADPLCPEAFVEFAKKEMLKWSDNDHLQFLSKESMEHFIKVNHDSTLLNNKTFLRQLLLDFIADFSNWDNSNHTEYLITSNGLTQSAHIALGGHPGTKPLMVDSFAGGGAIPIEGLRVGADSFATDINPIPYILNKVQLEYIPKYGKKLADEVLKWGIYINDVLKNELSKFYPTDKGNIPIAYLWCRAIVCEGPKCGVRIPLMKSLWLAKKNKNSTGLKFVISKKEIKFELITDAKPNDIAEGTVRRGAATCPKCGYTTIPSSVKRQLREVHGGSDTGFLIAVRYNNPGNGQRAFRLANAKDYEGFIEAKEYLEKQKLDPDFNFFMPYEETPKGGGSGAGRAFSQRNYGMNQFCDLFNSRQLLSLIFIAKKIKEIEQKVTESNSDKEFANSVSACLGLALSRLADFNSALCILNVVGGRGVKNTFSRQAIPMVWDYMETNPYNEVGANWLAGVQAAYDTIYHESEIKHSGKIYYSDATLHPLPDDSVNIFFTDPPYYDAVPYSDLSDFFFVWLKKCLPKNIFSDFKTQLSPKDEECIVDEVKGKDKEFFERTMGKAMFEGRRITYPNGIGIIVFAHKTTSGWESQLKAILDAGWIITGSWPIDTERPGRLRSQNSAALASSVHLVCRPRENEDGSIIQNNIGDWRDVQEELPKRIHEWMPRLAEEGVAGADAIFACLGPALEIFSRYSKVVQSGNERQITLREYLEKVWAAVSQEALNMVFVGGDAQGLEEDARLTAMWLWTLTAGTTASGSGEVDEEEEVDDEEGKSSGKLKGYTLEYDTARKIAQGLGANLEELNTLVEIKGDKARLVPVLERASRLFGATGLQQQPVKRKKKVQLSITFENVEPELESKFEMPELKLEQTGKTVLDRLHQAMLLFSSGRTEALKRFLVEDGAGKDDRFWKLAQSLTSLYPKDTDERRWVEAVQTYKKSLGF
jgi:putative DNA methylase